MQEKRIVSKSNLLEVKRKNDAYTKLIQKQLRSVPASILAAGAIAGFKAAITHTYQDSGQFAYNWQLSLGRSPSFNPANMVREKAGPYNQGDERTAKSDTKVFQHLMAVYQLPPSKYSSIKNSKLYKFIVTGNYSQVTLSNPLWDSKYGSYVGRTVEKGGTFNANAAIQAAITRAAHTAMKNVNKGKA